MTRCLSDLYIDGVFAARFWPSEPSSLLSLLARGEARTRDARNHRKDFRFRGAEVSLLYDLVTRVRSACFTNSYQQLVDLLRAVSQCKAMSSMLVSSAVQAGQGSPKQRESS
jgi:hypothetical protein